MAALTPRRELASAPRAAVLLLVTLVAGTLAGNAHADLYGTRYQHRVGIAAMKRSGGRVVLEKLKRPKVKRGSARPTLTKNPRPVSKAAREACDKGYRSFFLRTPDGKRNLFDVTFSLGCRGWDASPLKPLIETYYSKRRHHGLHNFARVKGSKHWKRGYRPRKVLAELLHRGGTKGTRPLYLYFHPKWKDYRAVSNPKSVRHTEQQGYQREYVLGYVFGKKADFEAAFPDRTPVVLRNGWHPKRKDSMMFAAYDRMRFPKGYRGLETKTFEGFAAAVPRIWVR